MTDTATAAPAAEAPLVPVFKPSDDGFAPRTRKSTSDALSALKPVLAQVEQASPKVVTILEGLTAQRAASLVSLLNERYDRRWTFGGRSTDDGTAIVQARYSASPELARPVRKVTRKDRPAKGTTTGQAKSQGRK